MADARRPSMRGRRVAVVGEHGDLELAGGRELIGEPVQLGELILRQRLGRKEEQRATRGIAPKLCQDLRLQLGMTISSLALNHFPDNESGYVLAR